MHNAVKLNMIIFCINLVSVHKIVLVVSCSTKNITVFYQKLMYKYVNFRIALRKKFEFKRINKWFKLINFLAQSLEEYGCTS